MINTQLLKQLYYTEETEAPKDTALVQPVAAEEAVPVSEVHEETETLAALQPAPISEAPEETSPAGETFARACAMQEAPAAPLQVPDCRDRILVTGNKDPGYPPALARLATDLAQNSALYGPFLQTLVRAYDSENKCFCYDMTNLPMADRQAVAALADRMVGLINRFHSDPLVGYIKGHVGNIPAIGSFLRSDYLELALKTITEQVVRQIAEQRGISWSVTANALISDGRFSNEADALIRLGNESFIIEAKAGKCTNVDFDKYYEVSRRYNLIPDHFLMVCDDLAEDSSQNIHTFYNYYVVAAKDYTAALKRMLGADVLGTEGAGKKEDIA